MKKKVLSAASKYPLFTYLSVGGITAVIYFGLVWLGIGIAELDYRLGIAIAYVVSVGFHFLANRNITFRSSNTSLAQQGIRYLVTLGFNYLITLFTAYLLIEQWHIPADIAASLSVLAPVIIGYLIFKLWVFRTKEVSND